MAGAGDAGRVAGLHAESWRRHYRGAFSDAFLDGDIVGDRKEVWAARLADPARTVTILAEDGGGLAGFVHVMLDEDETWGSLVDNLHVAHDRKRSGLGTALLTGAARATAEQAESATLHLWVLEQNDAARRFYRALGGVAVETRLVSPPGGVPERLNGSPTSIRMVWPDASALADRGVSAH